MATPGSDAINEVSKVFGQLADEGGAASDSFFALNNIIKNNLNRGFIKFSKNLVDINKSLNLQNKALKDFTKNLTKGIQVPARAKSKKEAGTVTGIPKQPKPTQDKQEKSTKLMDTLDTLADSMKNPLISVINDAGSALKGFMTVITNIGSMISSVVSLKALFEVSELQKAKANEQKATEELAAEKEKALLLEQEANSIRESENSRVERATQAISDLQENIDYTTEGLAKNIAAQKEYEMALDGIKEAIKSGAGTVITTLGGTGRKFTNMNEAIDEVSVTLENLKKNGTDLTATLEGLKKKQENAQKATSRLTEEQIKAQAETAAKGKKPELFGKKDAEQAGEGIKKYGAALAKVFQKLYAAMQVLRSVVSGRLLIGLGAIVGILILIGKYMISLAQNAVPQMIEFLIKPLEMFHDFVTGPLRRSFDTLTGFVTKLNPAYGEMASRALDDLSAIIGRVVLPIFITMVNLLKIFNNALFNNANIFNGVIKEFSKQLGEVGIVIIAEFFQLLKAMVPVLELLADAFKKVGPKLNGIAKKLAETFMKHLPTVMKVIDSLANIIDMWLNMKLQEFANQAALAAHAAQNNARAMELFGKEAISLSMMFNNLSYYIADFMLQLEAVFIELLGWAKWFMGDKSEEGLAKTGELLARNPMEALDRGNIPLLENVGIEIAEGTEDEMAKLNFAERAGAKTRKWIASLFGAEDMPWVENKKKIVEAQPEPGAGEFDIAAGADIGAPEEGLKEGFAARGAQFQEIGQLGRNLMEAAFGGGESIDEQQLDQLKGLNEKFQAMIDGQNKFNGMVPQQGVR